MVMRLGAAICVAVTMVVVYSSVSRARLVDHYQLNLHVVAAGPVISGIASTYNPYRPGYRSGGRETASVSISLICRWNLSGAPKRHFVRAST